MRQGLGESGAAQREQRRDEANERSGGARKPGEGGENNRLCNRSAHSYIA